MKNCDVKTWEFCQKCNHGPEKTLKEIISFINFTEELRNHTDFNNKEGQYILITDYDHFKEDNLYEGYRIFMTEIERAALCRIAKKVKDKIVLYKLYI